MSRHSVQNTGLVTNICAVKKEFWILQLVGKISYFFLCLLFLMPKKVTICSLFFARKLAEKKSTRFPKQTLDKSIFTARIEVFTHFSDYELGNETFKTFSASTAESLPCSYN